MPAEAWRAAVGAKTPTADGATPADWLRSWQVERAKLGLGITGKAHGRENPVCYGTHESSIAASSIRV